MTTNSLARARSAECKAATAFLQHQINTLQLTVTRLTRMKNLMEANEQVPLSSIQPSPPEHFAMALRALASQAAMASGAVGEAAQLYADLKLVYGPYYRTES